MTYLTDAYMHHQEFLIQSPYNFALRFLSLKFVHTTVCKLYDQWIKMFQNQNVTGLS